MRQLNYKCVGCGMTFYNEYNLHKHQRHCMYYGCEVTRKGVINNGKR